mgnify:FL=1
MLCNVNVRDIMATIVARALQMLVVNVNGMAERLLNADELIFRQSIAEPASRQASRDTAVNNNVLWSCSSKFLIRGANRKDNDPDVQHRPGIHLQAMLGGCNALFQ